MRYLYELAVFLKRLTLNEYLAILSLLSDLVADYEELHHPIQPPTLPEAIKL